MAGPYLRRRTPRSRYTSDREHAANVIQNYFRSVGSSSRSSARERFIARKRMAQLQAAGGFTGPDDVPASQSSNMTFSQGAVSSMTSGGTSMATGGTVFTGTAAANRQALRARRVLRGVRASSTRPTAMKAAMFIPGKGGEVDLIANNYLQPIVHKIPWKADKLRYDGISSALVNPKGNRLSMDFAFKMILECQKQGMTGNFDFNNPNDLVPTRFHCCNIFRHTNPNANGSAGGTTATNTASWNNTLGPDASYIRLLPAAGGSLQTGVVFPNNGLTNTVLSPYRYPKIGSAMYSRVSLQILENAGWNLNPFKLTGSLASDSFVQNVTAFANAQVSSPTGQVNQSAPHTQMQNTVSPHVAANRYITQHGPGGVRYNFSNDGTNAVTLECVIVGFKDSANASVANQLPLTKPYQTFMTSATDAYLNRMNTKKGVMTLAGDPHTAVPGGTSTTTGAAIFSNAETEFIPQNLWPYMGRTSAGTNDINTVSQPFKFISRDQFIIGGGQSRIWKTTFPADVYDASVDSPQSRMNINSHSFMVIWSVCSAPVPVLETSNLTTDAALAEGKIMLSREPQNCNVSCVGTYFETPTPVFAKVLPTPLNIIGSLSQVSVLPPAANPGSAQQWPGTSHPAAAGTIPIYNEHTGVGGALDSGLSYVDLPRSGQQPFIEPTTGGNATQPASTLPVGTLSTTQ